MLDGLAMVGLLGIAVLAAAIAVWLHLQRRHRRDCPSCGRTLVSLGRDGPDLTSRSIDGDPLTYEVLVCPTCTNALTHVHGARSRYAYCPECRHRTLETPCIRLPDSVDGRRRVEVHEQCTLCGHHDLREVGDPPKIPERRGQVIPFPVDRLRKKASNDQ